MNLIQALLIALLGYLGAKWSIPLMGDMGGYWTIGRPLVAGAIIGAILGDVQRGIILGCAINALFIGTVNVGGVTANDINFGTFIGIPLAMVAKASVEEACVLAALLGQLGLFIWNFTKIINVTWIRVIDKKLETGDLDAVANAPIYGQIFHFLLRFIPIFVTCYFGSTLMENIMAAIPTWLTGIVGILGGMLPIIGFVLIIKTCIKKSIHWLYFVLGFMLFTNFKVNILTILVIGLVLAYIDFNSSKKDGVTNE